GNPLAATSANADRVSGGTTNSVIKSTKINEAPAPTEVSSGTPICLAIKVRMAVASPASTSKVPRMNRHQRTRDEGWRTTDEPSGCISSFILPPLSLLLERYADRLHDFAEDRFCFFAAAHG